MIMKFDLFFPFQHATFNININKLIFSKMSLFFNQKYL